ncbi:hypothetical protein U1Q18_024497 [Sarracenia purpurea var. burkii]
MKYAWNGNMNLMRGLLRNLPSRAHEQGPSSGKCLFNKNCGSAMRSEKPRASQYTLDMVEAKEIAVKWLKSYAVGIAKEHMEVEAIQDAMASDGVQGIKFKALGENKALIIF